MTMLLLVLMMMVMRTWMRLRIDCGSSQSWGVSYIYAVFLNHMLFVSAIINSTLYSGKCAAFAAS